MDKHATQHYQCYSEENPLAHFHRVIALHEEPALDWEDTLQLAPTLPKGWYELAQLPSHDRIEFTSEFWSTTLSLYPDLVDFLMIFFSNIDDIGIFLTQRCYEDPFNVELVYSIKRNGGFFRGYPPIKEYEMIDLQKAFPDYILPTDYLTFLHIHNGFAKSTDTGIQKSNDMQANYQELQELLEQGDPLQTTSGTILNAKALIPFYKSFEMPFFQCFYAEWYPNQRMGNVYYSGTTHTVADFTNSQQGIESLAFESFKDWLIFYLEKVE